MKKLLKIVTMAAALGTASLGLSVPAFAWQPDKPINFIIMALLAAKAYRIP